MGAGLVQCYRCQGFAVGNPAGGPSPLRPWICIIFPFCNVRVKLRGRRVVGTSAGY